MNAKLRVALSLFVFLLLISCGEKEPVVPPIFELDRDYEIIDVHSVEGSERVPVTTNLNWDSEIQLSSDSDWCDVSLDDDSSNTILIEYENSEEVELRSALITIKTTAGDFSIKLRQIGIGAAILINPPVLTFDKDGQTLGVTVTSNVDFEVTPQAGSEWLTSVEGSKTKAMSDYSYSWSAGSNFSVYEREAIINFKSADGTVNIDYVINQAAQNGNPAEVEVPSDILIKPSGGSASESQQGQGIDKSYDGKFAADNSDPYHSPWGASANFPITLEYEFDSKPDMDYIVYYTRSGNGNFGELSVYIATEESPNYTLVGDYDFKMQNSPSKISFSETKQKVTKVKFEVRSGLNNFVSCDEMEFYKSNVESELNTSLLKVFTDITCSEIKSDATMDDIEKLPDYFKVLANTLNGDGYSERDANFRIREYKPYSNVEEWADKLMTNRYSPLDNCTGITVEADDVILVLVGETHGANISLQCITETEVVGDVYMLNEGINKLSIKRAGQLFVIYTDVPSSQPIKIHFPAYNGKVNGFFDINEHITDQKYKELLAASHYKYFFVRGNLVTFYFHRQAMLDVVPDQIISAVELWDDLVGWQQELMGIEDVRPSQVNNSLLAISVEEGYMWASQYRMGFIHTYLENILLRDKVMAAADNAWGPAHEMGHMHQQAINWPSAWESSNNLFSNYTIYKLGKYLSRGSELEYLARARYVNNNSWAKMENDSGGEDTELHMRMNWQLWNYFHRLGYKSNFFQELFKEMRLEGNRIDINKPGEAQMKFLKAVCKVANMDMTEFFDAWGFLIPVDATVEQYGTYHYVVTEQMITEAHNEMSAYAHKAPPIHYLEDRKQTDTYIGNYNVGDVGHYSQFADSGVAITKMPTYTMVDRTIKITDGEEAVAFEIVKNGEVIYFFNHFEMKIPDGISLDGIELKAVSAKGNRVEISIK